MYFTDRGIEELETRRGDEDIAVSWLAERMRDFVNLNPNFETAVDRLATYLARDDEEDLLSRTVWGSCSEGCWGGKVGNACWCFRSPVGRPQPRRPKAIGHTSLAPTPFIWVNATPAAQPPETHSPTGPTPLQRLNPWERCFYTGARRARAALPTGVNVPLSPL